MKILVSGSGGLIGSALVQRLTRAGHHVIPLKRAANPESTVAVASWNPDAAEVRLDRCAPLDAVVHLAGENIAQRWTPATKKRITDSRVRATRLLVSALLKRTQLPRVMICASATGYYGDRADASLNEQSGPGVGFLPDLCCAWEAAAQPAVTSGVRVVHLRLGIVLARQGGALAKMLPPFKLGMGGRMGTGRQYWSWIALEDVLRIIEHVLDSNSLAGPVNATAPNPLTNAQFTAALGRAVRRPAVIPVPGLLLKAVFGEMAQATVLCSARVFPDELLRNGFQFRFPTIDQALSHVLTP